MDFGNQGSVSAIGSGKTSSVDLWTKWADQKEQAKADRTEDLKWILCGAMQPNAYMN